MRCRYRIALIACLAVAMAGCGTSSQPQQKPDAAGAGASVHPADPAAEHSPAKTETALSPPAAAVHEFLEAVRTGDDEKAAAMLTDLAREKTAEQNIEVAPRGSDTAKFEVGEVEDLAEDAARVSVTWTDLDHTGQSQTNKMLWMVRKGTVGWRIAGMAAEVFPGEPPLLLDFEKPEETLEKLEMLEAEMRRLAEAEIAQSRQPQDSSESTRQ